MKRTEQMKVSIVTMKDKTHCSYRCRFAITEGWCCLFEQEIPGSPPERSEKCFNYFEIVHPPGI